MPIRFRLIFALCVTGFWLPLTTPSPIAAQEAPALTEAQKKEEAKRAAEAREALTTLRNLLSSRSEQQQAIKELKDNLREAEEDATKKELEAKISEAQNKLAQTEAQLTAISTGVADDTFSTRQGEPFDLQKEIVSLAEPFVKMMKDATATAREIDKLNATKSEAERQVELSRKALLRIYQLRSALPQPSANKDDKAKAEELIEAAHLEVKQKEWRKRLQEAEDLTETADQQLQLRMDQQLNSPSGIGQFATEFLRTRGLNLILAFAAFFGVFALFRLGARALLFVQNRHGIQRNFAMRVGGLIYQVLTVVVSLFAMLFVLNMLNDWILLGITSIFAVAIAWIGLKMLPAIVEQTTLLLNLGAVQEGERVLLNGVPWRVDRLDLYTDLVNPDLEGGTFTLPVRELVGLHSRPAANDEAWFPTRKGDWAQLADGRTGKVVIQTPELVQLVELGGSRITYATADFVANTPRNLSTGYRVEVTFGLDYRHQAEATREIPDKICTHVEAGLRKMLKGKGLRNVQVELAGAGDSSIDYEVEADIDGDFAHLYEDIEREMARLLVEACNHNNWTIPFPQMVLHRSA